MRKSIATVSIRGTLSEKIDAIAGARFDGLELFDNDLIASDLSPRQIAQRCDDRGLVIDIFQPIRDVEGWDKERFPAVLRRVRAKFQIMEELGATTTLACSNALPSAIDDLDLTAEQLYAVGDLAAEHGFLIAYEALAWGRHINRVGQAWEAVRRANHPNVGLAVDTFHMQSRGDGSEALADVPGNGMVFLQVADAPRMEMNLLEWSRHHRNFPGQGSLDVVGIVATVLESGYRGPLSLEVFSDVVREAPPKDTARDAMRSLLYLEELLRQRWQADAVPGASGAPEASDSVVPAPARPRVDLFDPPPVPQHVDFGFIEFAVEPGDTSFTELLAGLGFAKVGTHRTRPVQWWRNGQANVCVTTAPLINIDSRQNVRRPVTSALCLVSDNIADIATRASAYLWPPLRLRRGLDQAALTGMDTPDGLHVFVGGHTDRREDWRRDYVPIGGDASQRYDPTGPEFESGDWLGLDHVGVNVPGAAAASEESFFRTIFGLRAGETTEFIQPGGRVRSRPLRPDQGNVRIILSVTDGDRVGEIDDGISQVAFAVPDVFALVASARAAGVPLLDVPDNYYADLQARLELDAAFVARLRDNDVMYDEDGQGAMLHVYTETVNGCFYIEAVQRIDVYDGYDAPGTHVRLAAQARSAVTLRG